MKTEAPVSDFYCNKVLSGLVEIQPVVETERVLAFHHTNPSYPVHIVVIPKAHVPSLTDLGDADPGLVYEVVEVVREVAAMVEKEHGSCSVNTNLGLYQESKHMHWHVYYRGESESEILGMYGHHDR
ncbi:MULTISPECIES: HIT domain-containing protein [unclassified Streptomyces]|uniref:HIT domain-containing protein n=1 Tax=unclassified Streptomyces TaxID=2593676 RepID=UPI000DC7806D|nr:MULTISPECIES: HIT domain-containing protein [unclassified Streptomyces]AWZ03559.1 HIT family hydrolase [Streptomyces sp. ICC4]AWZ12582.1 HIT family hydrolase [Streptomyces sp. ICC1]